MFFSKVHNRLKDHIRLVIHFLTAGHNSMQRHATVNSRYRRMAFIQTKVFRTAERNRQRKARTLLRLLMADAHANSRHGLQPTTCNLLLAFIPRNPASAATAENQNIICMPDIYSITCTEFISAQFNQTINITAKPLILPGHTCRFIAFFSHTLEHLTSGHAIMTKLLCNFTH